MRVHILGDSLVHGTGDPEGLGYVGRLPIMEDLQYFRLGVPGQTTAEILTRAFHEVSARMVPYHDNLIIIAATLNDLGLDDKDKMRTNNAMLTAQWQALLEAMRKLAPVLALGPTPVMGEFNPYFVSALNADLTWKNVVISQVNNELSEIAAKLEIPYLDLYDALKNDPSYLGSLRDCDGLHPETMGYIAIADYINNWKKFRSQLPDAKGDEAHHSNEKHQNKNSAKSETKKESK